MNNLALMLNNGEGVEINKKEAAFFFKKAADNGMLFAADKWKIIEFPKRMNDKKNVVYIIEKLNRFV